MASRFLDGAAGSDTGMKGQDMSESMRGTRLGATSYENDAHVAPAESLATTYVCDSGHRTVVPFSVEAEELPYEWTCRCGRAAVRPDVRAPESKPERRERGRTARARMGTSGTTMSCTTFRRAPSRGPRPVTDAATRRAREGTALTRPVRGARRSSPRSPG